MQIQETCVKNPKKSIFIRRTPPTHLVREYYQFRVAELSIDYSGCEAHANVSIRQFHVEYQENRCHAIQARHKTRPIKHNFKGPAITKSHLRFASSSDCRCRAAKIQSHCRPSKEPEGFLNEINANEKLSKFGNR